MRDKDGRVLVNAHVLGERHLGDGDDAGLIPGFLRRINKLLFHGIKPVFVFDGGAPALKRSTIVSALHALLNLATDPRPSERGERLVPRRTMPKWQRSSSQRKCVEKLSKLLNSMFYMSSLLGTTNEAGSENRQLQEALLPRTGEMTTKRESRFLRTLSTLKTSKDVPDHQ